MLSLLEAQKVEVWEAGISGHHVGCLVKSVPTPSSQDVSEYTVNWLVLGGEKKFCIEQKLLFSVEAKASAQT